VTLASGDDMGVGSADIYQITNSAVLALSLTLLNNGSVLVLFVQEF
jgi:hypothetical protein